MALYVLDPVALATAGPFRRDLLIGHLAGLERDLARRGGGLVVRRGDPAVEVPAVARAVGASAVHANAGVTAYSRRRDRAVAAELPDGVALELAWGTLVHEPGSVVAGSTGSVHRVFSPFHRAWSSAPVTPWPEPGDAAVASTEDLDVATEPLPEDGGASPMEAGTDAAHRRLSDWLERVDGYVDTRDAPADDEGTSHLSADLRWGTLSPRHVVDVVGTTSEGRAAFVRQLAWRDWFAHLLHAEPGLARHAMRPELDGVRWLDDPEGVDAWREGRTGVPIVDAGMRQLATTGWMHGRVRMVAASFLVKDLLVDWRTGEAHFRRLLVDGEPAQDVGNWQWVAGTGPDAAPYFRVLNPVTQSRRFDPDGEYLARWVPELAGLPPADRHAPWELGPLELAAAGVELGVDYPMPLVDHAAARERAIAAYSAARGEATP